MLKNEKIKPNFSELERVYGTSRKTIRKYYHQEELPMKQTRIKGSSLDHFKEEIIHKLSIPGITFKAAFEYFKDKYPDEKAFNSASTFRWYCNYRLNTFIPNSFCNFCFWNKTEISLTNQCYDNFVSCKERRKCYEKMETYQF